MEKKNNLEKKIYLEINFFPNKFFFPNKGKREVQRCSNAITYGQHPKSQGERLTKVRTQITKDDLEETVFLSSIADQRRHKGDRVLMR